jgi:hypothetical protein
MRNLAVSAVTLFLLVIAVLADVDPHKVVLLDWTTGPGAQNFLFRGNMVCFLLHCPWFMCVRCYVQAMHIAFVIVVASPHFPSVILKSNSIDLNHLNRSRSAENVV